MDKHGVEDLYQEPSGANGGVDDEIAEYEPSLPDPEMEQGQTSLSPDLEEIDDLFRAPFRRGTPAEDHYDPKDAAVKAIGARSQGGEAPASILEEQVLPSDPKELRRFIEDLKGPVDQVVLRYFVGLRSKTGADVTEAVQKLVLGINKSYPVKTKFIHCDPGTEFSSYALSKWLVQQNIAAQHSLPTDKRGNGLAERTVGWVKSRVRTLLRAANLPVQRWPLAARWATAAYMGSM